MGLIKAAIDMVTGSLADQWLEVFEAEEMGANTVFTQGAPIRQDGRRSGSNTKGTENLITNGSKIHVGVNQMMILVDGGKIVQSTVEPGYYTVDNSTAPSFFNGEFGDTFKEAINRFKFGGVTPNQQRIFFINMKPILGIKFGTPNPIGYFDNMYNSELFLRAHGTYSIKIKNPILFYSEIVPSDSTYLEIGDLSQQFTGEFLTAFGTSLSMLSVEGQRISHITSKTQMLADKMKDVLDEAWSQVGGFEIERVAVSISYDDESKELIKMRNQGAMLSDPTVREGYVQGAMARGMEAAGSNAGGAMAGFMGMGMGMQAGGGFMGAASQSNQAQMQMQQQQQQTQMHQQQQAPATNAPAQNGWACGCGTTNTGKFCNNCGKPPVVVVAADNWTCECGTTNEGKFCVNCGKKPTISTDWVCECGLTNSGKFCQECGKQRLVEKTYRCDKCGFEPDKDKPIPKFCPECGDPINEADLV